MIFAIDIGNTNITIGCFKKEVCEVVHYANIKTDKGMTTDDLAIKYMNLLTLWSIDKSDVVDVFVSSVVPSLEYPVTHMFEKYYGIKPSFAERGDMPIKLDYDNPREIGPDRIVNAYAGMSIYPGENLIIVDFGTATTFDILSSDAVYMGGIIVPGIMTSLRSMTEKASRLPHIDLSVTSGLIGKNTVDGIRSGVLHGNGAMVDELVKRMVKELNWSTYKVIATGGLADLIRLTCKSFDEIHRHLTLKGLYYVWKRNNV